MIILHYFVGRVEAVAKPIGVNLRTETRHFEC